MSYRLNSEMEYRLNHALSQSDLKQLLVSPKLFYEAKHGRLEKKTSAGFAVGSLVDCKVLTPNEFNTRFCIQPKDIAIPSRQQEKDFCALLQQGKTEEEAQAEVYTTKNPATAKAEAKKRAEKFNDYLNYLAGVDGRIEVLPEDMQTTEKCISSLKAHRYGRFLFGLGKDGGLHKDSQVPIVFELKDLSGKALIDKIVIHSDSKTIYLIDLKTTSDIYNFDYSYKKYKYGFQLAWYRVALGKYINAVFPHLKDYTIRTMIVAVDTTGIHETRVFEPSEALFKEHMDEVKQAVSLYRWHKEKNIWNMTKEEYDNEGVLTLGTWREKNAT